MVTKYNSPPSQTSCPKLAVRGLVPRHNVIRLYKKRLWWNRPYLKCINCDGEWDL